MTRLSMLLCDIYMSKWMQQSYPSSKFSSFNHRLHHYLPGCSYNFVFMLCKTCFVCIAYCTYYVVATIYCILIGLNKTCTVSNVKLVWPHVLPGLFWSINKYSNVGCSGFLWKTSAFVTGFTICSCNHIPVIHSLWEFIGNMMLTSVTLISTSFITITNTFVLVGHGPKVPWL